MATIKFEILPQNKSLMSAVYFVRTLILLNYLGYTHPDILKEFRRYHCTLDGQELKYCSVCAHFYHHHRNVYIQVRKIVDEHLEVYKDTVLCDCGGRYRKSGAKDNELTGIHQKWQVTNNRYSPFTTPKQTLSTLIE